MREKIAELFLKSCYCRGIWMLIFSSLSAHCPLRWAAANLNCSKRSMLLCMLPYPLIHVFYIFIKFMLRAYAPCTDAMFGRAGKRTRTTRGTLNSIELSASKLETGCECLNNNNTLIICSLWSAQHLLRVSVPGPSLCIDLYGRVNGHKPTKFVDIFFFQRFFGASVALAKIISFSFLRRPSALSGQSVKPFCSHISHPFRCAAFSPSSFSHLLCFSAAAH